MYHLQVSPKKSFTYISRTDSIFATIQDRKVDEFTNEQRGLQLVVLAQKRQTVARFAEPFKTHAAGMESVSRARGLNEDKDAVKKILEDVFLNRLKPMFPAEFEEIALEQEEIDRRKTRGTMKSTETATPNARGEATPPLTPLSSGKVELPAKPSKKRKLVKCRDSECGEPETLDDLTAIKKRVAQLKTENKLLEKAYEEAFAREWAKMDMLDRKNQELKAKLEEAKDDEFSSDEDTE